MKPKKCKLCREPFTPRSSWQIACSPAHALALLEKKKEKARAKERSAERKADKAKREKLKTRSDWIKDAQNAVNRYVRMRDSGRGCISCGEALGDGGTGGGFDAGHYRSRGSAPHLRFDERNIHGQCKRCNRYLSGNATEFRAGLVSRYGLRFVEALEADQEQRKYDIAELREIRDKYRRMANELEKQ